MLMQTNFIYKANICIYNLFRSMIRENPYYQSYQTFCNYSIAIC